MSIEHSSLPEWFTIALQERPESFMCPIITSSPTNSTTTTTTTEPTTTSTSSTSLPGSSTDIRVHCLRWGGSNDSTKRGLLFIHGNGASNMWFKCIAPFFSRDFDVVALSLTGCGGSSWKVSYTVDAWGNEVQEVCRQLGFFMADRPKPYVVAHSFGCYTVHSMLWRQLFGTSNNNTNNDDNERLFDGVVYVDVAIRSEEMTIKVGKRMQQIRAKDPNMKPRPGWKRNPPTITPLERYVLRPFQKCENTFIVRNIADSSIRRYEDGSWTWLGDPNRENKMDWKIRAMTDVSVRKIAERMPVAYMYGEMSVLCDNSVTSFVRESLGNDIGIIKIPQAQHHVWLDQPLAFISALQGIFGGWNSFAFPSKHRDGNNNKEEDVLDRIARVESKL
jgi:pimeloyl-ACP methyl ester carboxylesterase